MEGIGRRGAFILPKHHDHPGTHHDDPTANDHHAPSMISCVMPTYRRMNCVERSLNLFCRQDHMDSELVIFNTDESHPVRLSDDFEGRRILVVNNGTDYQTELPYQNIGAIRRDALHHARGEFYICWDDDDIFLPWNNRQCFDGIYGTDFWAWKPYSSMSKISGKIKVDRNVMEASIISRLDKIREFGYVPHPGGGEHTGWYQALERAKRINVEEKSVPGYSFNWSDPPQMGGHKNSGSINHPDNFFIHQKGCTDIHTRPLSRLDVSGEIAEHVKVLRGYRGECVDGHRILPEIYDRYILPHE